MYVSEGKKVNWENDGCKTQEEVGCPDVEVELDIFATKLKSKGKVSRQFDSTQHEKEDREWRMREIEVRCENMFKW